MNTLTTSRLADELEEGNIQQLSEIFGAIPIDPILNIAQDIAERMKENPTLVEMKAKKQFVTQADRDIQLFLINFFEQSPLAGTFYIKAEEDLTEAQKAANTPAEKKWQLVIDPLDGTSNFCKGNPWGVMIALCDESGKIVFSWNLTSDGKVYQTDSTKAVPSVRPSLQEKEQEGKLLRIDVYDYGAGAAEKFPQQFSSSANVEVTSCPAAVLAGRQLYDGELDALLWIPSDQGKGNYPDNDLGFLGALASQGFRIRLGKVGDNVEMVVVAPTDADADRLYETGVKMISPEKAQTLQKINDLIITSPLQEAA